MISDYEEVVIRFKAYRISYPLTQKELSDKSGVSLRSITRFESGEDISLVNFMKLMNAMEICNLMNTYSQNCSNIEIDELGKLHVN